jgi:hypothetical protein
MWGCLTQAEKVGLGRLRGKIHGVNWRSPYFLPPFFYVQAGSDSWDPTDAELRDITTMFMDAETAKCVDENSNVIATAAYNLKSRLSVITTRRNINIVGTWSFAQDRIFAFVMAVTSAAMLCINLFSITHQ